MIIGVDVGEWTNMCSLMGKKVIHVLSRERKGHQLQPTMNRTLINKAL